VSFTDHRFDIFSGAQKNETDKSMIIGAFESNAFFSLNWDIVENLRLESGLRYTSFSPGHYGVFEPRLSITAGLTPSITGTISFDRCHQFIHSLSSFSLMSPGELYYPSTRTLGPEVANQGSAGLKARLEDPFETGIGLMVSLEGYYKEMAHLPQLKQTYASLVPSDFEQEIIVGTGKSYGIELSVERTDKDSHLWINYTWSRSSREFAEYNRGNSFPATFQREHNLNITGDLRSWKPWTVAITFVLASGQPTTLPAGRLSFNGNMPNSNYSSMIDYGDLNSSMLPVYNRLDIGVNYGFRWLGGEWKLQLNVYNIYGYPNPLFNFFDVRAGKFEQISLGVLPTIGINFVF
jgi:hypothetical protein